MVEWTNIITQHIVECDSTMQEGSLKECMFVLKVKRTNLSSAGTFNLSVTSGLETLICCRTTQFATATSPNNGICPAVNQYLM